jgi:hypothetical protein
VVQVRDCTELMVTRLSAQRLPYFSELTFVYVLTIARGVAKYERLGNTPIGRNPRRSEMISKLHEKQEECTVISPRESDRTFRLSMILPRTSVGWRAIHFHEPSFCSEAAQEIALA